MNRTKNFLVICVVGLLCCALVIIIVDPYFHFHRPISVLSYNISNERYINDGIGRNFTYDSVIIGTSMTQNFRASEYDSYFDACSIKTPYAGAGYQEISEALLRILRRNSDVKSVLWGIDYGMLGDEKDASRYSGLPDYLYDDKISNDMSYILNKEVLMGTAQTLLRSIGGGQTTTMDEYDSWTAVTGEVSVKNNYERPEKIQQNINQLNEVEIETTRETVHQNIVSVISKYPNTTFRLFITPYSIVYWDSLNQTGEIERQIQREAILLDEVLSCPNAEIYCFFDNDDLICNLDNYKDPGHHNAEINSHILECMSRQKYRITEQNMEEHLREEREFFLHYDYDKLFDGEQ